MFTYILLTFLLASGEYVEVQVPGTHAVGGYDYIVYDNEVTCDVLLSVIADVMALEAKAGHCALTTVM